MMAAYVTCFGCSVDKNSCPKRQEIKEAIFSMSITSVKFKCAVRVPHFMTGERVEVSLPVYGSSMYDDDTCDIADYNGTIIRERSKPGSFKVKLDDGMSICGDYGPMPDASRSKTGYVAVIAKYIKRIDQKSQSVCPVCESVGGGHQDGYICHHMAAC